MTSPAAPIGMHTAVDIAHLVGRSERTVQRRAAEGRYPSHRLGDRLVFTDDDVLDILTSEPEAARG